MINGKTVRAIVDTGASDCLISKQKAQQFKMDETGVRISLKMTDGRIITAQHICNVKFTFGSTNFSHNFIVVGKLASGILLGMDLGKIQVSLAQINQVKDLDLMKIVEDCQVAFTKTIQDK